MLNHTHCNCDMCRSMRDSGTKCSCYACSACQACVTEREVAARKDAVDTAFAGVLALTPRMERFWVVMNIDVTNMRCTFRHATEAQALAEMERLQRQNGGTFAVFELKAAITPVVNAVHAIIDEPLPF